MIMEVLLGENVPQNLFFAISSILADCPFLPLKLSLMTSNVNILKSFPKKQNFKGLAVSRFNLKVKMSLWLQKLMQLADILPFP